MGSLVPRGLGNKPQNEMLVFSSLVKGYEKEMSLLVDSGASQNFVSKAALLRSLPQWDRLTREGKRENMVVRLADGSTVRSEGVLVELPFKFCDFVCNETFVVLEMGAKYDLILGMPWLAKHQPWIDWRARTIGSSSPSSDERRARELFLAIDAETTTNAAADHPASGSKTAEADHPASRPASAVAVSPAGRTKSAVAGSPAPQAASRGIRKTVAGSPASEAESLENAVDPDVDPTDESGSKRTESTSTCDGDGASAHTSTCSNHPRGDEPSSTASLTRASVNRKGRRKLPAKKVCSAFAADAEEGPSSHLALSATPSADTSDCATTDRGAPESKRARGADATDKACFAEFAALYELPSEAQEILSLEELSYDLFHAEMKRGEIREIVVPTAFTRSELSTSSTADESVLETDKQKRFNAQDWDALKGSPYFDVLWEFKDVFPSEMPSTLPIDRGVRHEIDLEPGTKYCVTRQWPLPREQVDTIDEFFAKRALAGHVRESKSPHSSPTFCVRKATGGWRIVHAFNKLNAATIPAQTPIPRKDVLLDSMGGSTVFSALDLMDGFYQILMRQEDIPLTAVSTPSGMLWEWLVMPQGLRNAPATFNRLVTHLLRPHRAYAPSYFDDIFVHSRAEGNISAVEMHKKHLASVLQCLQDNSLYCNLKKCVFGAPEIPILGCYVGKAGVRADPEKIKAIGEWPVPRHVKDLRKWLGLANYLHKYSHNFAARVRPLTHLLKKDVEWDWTPETMAAFEDVK